MKGSLASMFTAVAEVKDTRGLMVLCYIDEEYDFAGMRSFVKEYADKIKPELVISLDGYADTIGYSCRGLIEVRFKVRGKSGHAGRPDLGRNAILIGTKIVNNLIEIIKPGGSSCNLAYLNGGLDLGDGKIGQEGNNIANIAELVLDIRPNTPEINANKVKEIINNLALKNEVNIENWSVRHNLGSWETPISTLQGLLDIPGKYEPFKGYVDTQMLAQAWGVSCCAIGASTLSCAHGTDEYVLLEDLEHTYLNVKKILKKFVK
jgi:acetylornithine deacetylase/succinyl-diaminopimelate desuccinylase-like protein